MRSVIHVILVLSGIINAALPPDTCRQDTWVPNGTVNTIVPAGDKVYIGGNFTQIGPVTGSGVPVSISSGKVFSNYPKLNGYVYTICSDNNNGWFVCGNYHSNDHTIHEYLVHILSNGTVDPSWNPDPDLSVRSLTLIGNILYVTGYFTKIFGQTRNGIAAIDIRTGYLTSLNPEISGTVEVVAQKGNTLYVGGYIYSVNGQSRHNIAAIDALDGSVTSWSPVVNNSVSDMVIVGNTIYIGGQIVSVNGTLRGGLAAIDATTGNVTDWNPDVDGNSITPSVGSMVLDGNTLYVAGNFLYIGGQSRKYIGAVDITTGTVSSWNPGTNNTISSMKLKENVLYIGGSFTKIGNETRNYIGAIDATTGTVTNWHVNVNREISDISVNGDTLYLAGYFNSVGGYDRSNIARIDALTGEADNWNPDANNTVSTILLNESKVFAGGSFTSIGGQTRNYIAAIDTVSGQATELNINANNSIYALSMSGITMYAGGYFTSINGVGRNHIAAIDATSGTVLNWNPNADGPVHAIAVSGNNVYIGGEFTNIGGTARKYVAAIDDATGIATSWNPNPNSTINSIAAISNTVFIGGYYSLICGQPRNYIAAIDGLTGNCTPWNPNPNAFVTTLTLWGNTVLIGGAFTDVGGQDRHRLAQIDMTTGTPSSWKPNIGDTAVVATIATNGATVYAGGNFEIVTPEIKTSHLLQFGAYTPSSSPILNTISPSSNFKFTGSLSTTLTGNNFLPGATAKLAKSGHPDVIATNVAILSSTQITCTFDLTTAVTGLWDVVVTNSDATSATLPNGFTVLPVPAPQPFSPIDSSNGNSLTPLLMWHKATDDSVYVLQLSTSNIFDGGFLLNNKQVIDTVEPIPPGILLSETWYHWRVAVIKKGGTTSDFSKEWRFETTYGTPAVPTLVYPLNNALNQDAPVHFFWQSRYNTDSSRIQVSTAADFRDTVMDSTSNNDTIVGNSLLKGNTYYWRVKAKNATGESDWSAVWSFSTLPAAPATVILDSPSDRNADIPINTTQLNWHKVPDATTYHLQIARDSIFTIIFKQDSALTDTITGCGALAYSTTYFWRVRAKNAGGAGEWSLFRRFTTVAPEAPPQVTLSAPLNGSINTPVAQLLRWTGIGSDITYHIQISDTSDFSYTRLDSSGIIADSMSASLWRNRLFYWRVCAVRAGVAGPWSDTWTFTTLPTVPDTVPVYTPPNQVNTPLNTTIVWGRVPGTVTFHVQIALDSLFISMLRNDSSFTDTVLNISGLENGTKYFWRVRASNAGGIGAWTSVVSFTTIVALPAIQTLQQLTIGDSVRVDTAVIKWSAGYPVADRYWLEYGTDSTFTNTFQDSSLADTTMVLRNLSNDITVYWRIKAHNVAGWGAWSAVSLFRVRIPTVGLMRSIPKNYTFTISGHNGCFMYTLPSAELVSFKLYDIKGRVRKELVNKHQTPGFYKLLLNDNTFASGTYLLKFRAGKFSTKKTLTIFH